MSESFEKHGKPGYIEAKAQLGKRDLYYLLRHLLHRPDIAHDWLFARCREVQASPNGHLDLWAREHYKSTIITFGLTIQDILNDPEITVGIFSHTNKIAKGFLRQIKVELETNDELKECYPEVLWSDPRKEAPKWTEDDGICVKRKGNPKELTVEAFGLVDGQPTSRHFSRMIYDDVVTRESVTSPDMIRSVTTAWELSRNLASEGGATRYIGTRYHFNDTYNDIMARGAGKPRIYPATNENDEPVLMSRASLDIKRREMGPYTYSCHVAGTRVLLADWSERPIEELQVGDQIVGWAKGDARQTLCPTKVVAVRSRKAPAMRAILESGRIVECTYDHKWYTGRSGTDSHSCYAPLGFNIRGGGEVSALCSVYDPRDANAPFPIREAGYLAGIFDGEGSVSGSTLHIAQSNDINPRVVMKIRDTLTKLGFDFNEFVSADRPGHRDFALRGGREMIIRFLRQCQPAKAPRIIEALYENGTRNFGKGTRDKLVSVENIGEREVWNIQTETGNYVAGGYASKNCQMLQNPKADNVQGFKDEWLRFSKDRPEGDGMNVYILVDPASAKKKDSDYTSAWVLGLAADRNYYMLDMVRDRLSLTERADMVFTLHRRWKPSGVGYERYGMMADIEHMRDRMDRENYHFDITELSGQMPKMDRIRRLIPVFEQGRFWLLPALSKRDYEGKQQELIEAFLGEEYRAFPVGAHDDMLDSLSRILDTDFNATWPMPIEEPVVDRYARPRYGKRNRSAWAA